MLTSYGVKWVYRSMWEVRVGTLKYIIIAQYGISAQGRVHIIPKLIHAQGIHSTVHYRVNKHTGQDSSWK